MWHGRTSTGVESQAGFTVAEFALGLVFIALGSSVLFAHLAMSYTAALARRDALFAYTSAQSILSELHALAGGVGGFGDFDLMALDDGSETNPTLSVAERDGVLVLPDDVNSRNIRANDQWLWSRRINVEPLPGLDNRRLRYVTVDILKRDRMGIERQMTSLSSLINLSTKGFPSTQVFDIFFLALENVPGWWVNMEAVRPYVESAVADLEVRNPGLRFRTHWITKLGYGRNPVYRPYLNTIVDTEQDIASAYFYPGRLPTGGAISHYYVADRFAARMLTDSGEINGYDAELNPSPYALSDFYNHTMRLPRERALHGRRTAQVRRRRAEIEAAIRRGTPPPDELLDMSEEPTLRLFLEDLNTDQGRYRHAIIVNLHGELMPLPPLRNYSDPARLPRLLPGVRVVTHPEQLRTERPTEVLEGEDVRLRVYAYTADPADYNGPESLPQEYPIAVDVMGLDLTDNGGPSLRKDVHIRNLRGGVAVGGDDHYYPFTDAKLYSDPTREPDEMGYRSELIDPGPGKEKITRIWLFHTPVMTPVVDGRGLEDTVRSRLYGLEYVPSCTGSGLDFSRDLYAKDGGPKNTARWTIEIPKSAFANSLFLDAHGSHFDPADDVRLTVRSYLWDGALAEPWAAGTMYPTPVDPENISETYTWWADSRDDVPVTERSQFLGDPRHNPYRDLLRGDQDFPNGYNWYHDALDNDSEDGPENSVADYPGLDADRLENRYDKRVRADLPRFFQVLRGGLVGSGTVYTALTGRSYYYVGMGNEIGADGAVGYPDSLPMSLRPFGEPGAVGTINNVTPRETAGNSGGRRFVRDGRPAPNHWWGMPWLGEHYPDRVYSTQWMALDGEGKVNGNLFAGVGADEFYRELSFDVHANSRFSAHGTRLDRSLQRADERACASAFNIGTPSSTFSHIDSPGTGTLVSEGIELAANYGLNLPTTLPVHYPFDLNGAGTNPDFGLSPYNNERYSAELLNTYYRQEGGLAGSGLVQLIGPQDSAAGFQVVNGLAPSGHLGAAEILRFALVAVTHSFFEAGDSNLSHRIPQTPRVTINSPTELTELIDPRSIDIRFDIAWSRWDGRKYTETPSPDYAEDETGIEYVVSYSPDQGRSWFHVDDRELATPGTRPVGPAQRYGDRGPGPESITWRVPAASFPQGSYILRVEAYRRGQNLHYALHQVRTYIER
jgi:hypothetical protein